jgi:hypothetical protein
MNVKYNPGSVFQRVIVNKQKIRNINMSTSQSYHMLSNLSKYLRVYMMI